MKRGFYTYLMIMVVFSILLGEMLRARIDGDLSDGMSSIILCLVFVAGSAYAVIDEWKLKEAYTTAEERISKCE
jgi:hypothetical protein